MLGGGRNGVVRILTRLRDGRPRKRGSIPGRGKRCISSQKRWDRLWGPPSLLFNGYWGLFLWIWSSRSVKHITHCQLVPKSRMSGATSPLSHTPSWWAQGQLFLLSYIVCVPWRYDRWKMIITPCIGDKTVACSKRNFCITTDRRLLYAGMWLRVFP
jgi:hypothetical protein